MSASRGRLDLDGRLLRLDLDDRLLRLDPVADRHGLLDHRLMGIFRHVADRRRRAREIPLGREHVLDLGDLAVLDPEPDREKAWDVALHDGGDDCDLPGLWIGEGQRRADLLGDRVPTRIRERHLDIVLGEPDRR